MVPLLALLALLATSAHAGTVPGPPPPDSVLVTGGYGPSAGSRLSTTELYGSTCSVPALPGPRSGPLTFLTADARVATCGGSDGDSRYLRSCLVLAPGSGWQEGRMGSLGVGRDYASVTSLPEATFILSGDGSRTSEVLLAGEYSWREGPAIPISMYGGCAVMISATQFLAIRDGNIREFDTSVSGPLSTAGWRPAGTWPQLATTRTWHGCAATGGRVVVAGGRGGWSGNRLESIEVIDISTHRVTAGPELLEARSHLQLAVLPAPGGAGARVLAIGGDDGDKYLDSVEEWLPGPGGTSTWRQLAPLQGARARFSVVALPVGLVCPA